MPLNFLSFLDVYNTALETVSSGIPVGNPSDKKFSVGSAQVDMRFTEPSGPYKSFYGTMTFVKISQGSYAITETGSIIGVDALGRMARDEGSGYAGKVDDKFAFEKWLSKKSWDYDATNIGTHRDTLKKGAKIGDGYTLKLSGNDTFLLGKGNDDFFSGGGKDLLDGGWHNDILDGGKGDDTVIGGRGNDVVIGSQGDDTLTGGKGQDNFRFAKHFDKDTITDFRDNTDTIVLNDNLWKGHKSVRKVLNKFGEMVDGDLVLDFGGGDVLTVEDTKKMQLVNDVQIV